MTTEKIYQIAIDGPSGAGKSTIARTVARRLGIDYIDTGAMYRAFGLKMLRQGHADGSRTRGCWRCWKKQTSISPAAEFIWTARMSAI